MDLIHKAILELKELGNTQIRAYGGSMSGRIESGQLVTLCTVNPDDVVVGDIALERWKRTFILHIIKEINLDQFLIGNNLGKINGWIPKHDLIARVTKIGD